MVKSTYFRKCTLFRKVSSLLTAFAFIFTSLLAPTIVSAQSSTILNLPVPGTMINPTKTFHPVLAKGIEIHPDNPLMFDFIMDTGHTNLDDQQFEKESSKLVNYFLAALAVPEEEMWVNLSPYEANRIIPASFGQTEMGRDLLAQDYILKQLSASLVYPEDELGQEFWHRVQAKAQAKYGDVDIPMNTFNKIWILPEVASVYEYEKGAFVTDSRLKVMLEEDYLALEMNQNSTAHGLGDVSQEDLDVVTGLTSEVVRDVLIPEIEREVNEGQHFANLRQIYHAMILATWYKQRLKDSLLGQVYADQKKVQGIAIEDKKANEQIYQQYVKAFKKGVYNYIKEEYDQNTQKIIPKKYFSGGATARGLEDLAMISGQGVGVSAQSVKPIGQAKRVAAGVEGVFDEKIDEATLLPEDETKITMEKVSFVRFLAVPPANTVTGVPIDMMMIRGPKGQYVLADAKEEKEISLSNGENTYKELLITIDGDQVKLKNIGTFEIDYDYENIDSATLSGVEGVFDEKIDEATLLPEDETKITMEKVSFVRFLAVPPVNTVTGVLIDMMIIRGPKGQYVLADAKEEKEIPLSNGENTYKQLLITIDGNQVKLKNIGTFEIDYDYEKIDSATLSGVDGGFGVDLDKALIVEGAESYEISELDLKHQVKFQTAGWRGKLDPSLGEVTEGNISRVAAAAAEEILSRVEEGRYVPNNPEKGILVHVAFDARKYSDAFATVVLEVLASYKGIRLELADTHLPTPAVTGYTRQAKGDRAPDFAIHFTASHNDTTWHGVKILQRGAVNPDEFTFPIADRSNKKTKYPRMPKDKMPHIPKVDVVSETTARYDKVFPQLERAIKAFRETNPDVEITVDTMHGGASSFAEYMRNQWGVDVIRTTPMSEETHPTVAINEKGEEVPWRPDPTKPYFFDQEKFQKFKDSTTPDGSLYMGIDGDGDRLVVWVKKNGKAVEIKPNKSAPLQGWYMKKTGRMSPNAKMIVKSVVSSYGMNALARWMGLPLKVIPVGSKFFEPYSIDSSKQKAHISMEESGHFQHLIVNMYGEDEIFYDDTVFQVGLYLAMMAETQKNLIDLKEQMEEEIGFRGLDDRDNPVLTEEQAEKVTRLTKANPRQLAEEMIQEAGKTSENVESIWVIVQTGEYDFEAIKLEDLEAANDDLPIQEREGIVVVYDNQSWHGLRLSGTEDVGRFYSEAQTEEERVDLNDALGRAVNQAMVVQPIETVIPSDMATINGGIDLNSAELDLQTSNTGEFAFPVPSAQMLQQMNQAVEFVPYIRQITPIMNLPLTLGLVDQEETLPIADKQSESLDQARNEYFDRIIFSV